LPTAARSCTVQTSKLAANVGQRLYNISSFKLYP